MSTLAELGQGRRQAHRRLALGLTLALVLGSLALPPAGPGLQLALAALAVLTLGLPHGAFDVSVALHGAHGLRPLPFLLGYAALAALVVLAWVLAPLPSLGLFLVLSWVHFGRGDRSGPGRPGMLQVLVRGAMPIVLPVALHPAQAAEAFGWLVAQPAEPLELALTRASTVLGLGWLAAALGLLALELRVREAEPIAWLEVALLASAFAVLPPLLSFALYFALWHSTRHLLDLDTWLVRGAKKRRRRLLLTAAPILAATLLGLALAYAALARAELDPQAGAQVLFVGLAALTLPHLLVTWLVERGLQQPAPTGQAGAAWD